MVVDENEFEVQEMFFSEGKSALDKFGKVLSLVLGGADDGEIHGLDYIVGDPGLEPGTI